MTGGILRIALVALLVPPAAAHSAVYPTVEETRAEFQALCERLEKDSPRFGRDAVQRLQERFGSPDLDPGKRWQAAADLGAEMLRIGRFDWAARTLEQAGRLAERAGLEAGDPARRRLHLLRGIAHLEIDLAESCGGRQAALCTLPLAPGAAHPDPAPARRAAEAFLAVLEGGPPDAEARWLLNLSRRLAGEWPDGVPEALRAASGLLAAPEPFAPWRDLAPGLGLGEADLGGGAVVEDLDGDGLLDLVSSSADPCRPLAAFRNDGMGGFEDVAAAWGLDGQLGGSRLVQADADGDGRADLLVLRGAGLGADGRIRNSLLLNELDGDAGRFVDVTAAAGLAYPAYPAASAAWADADGDGDLDLFVGNDAPGPLQLFRNRGDGTFVDVARRSGLASRAAPAAAAWGDVDDDGDPDLFVSAAGDNLLFRNRGDGAFVEGAAAAGVAAPDASSAAGFFDLDNDGDLDLYVGEVSATAAEHFAAWAGGGDGGGRLVVYRNDGGGTFTPLPAAGGLGEPVLPVVAEAGDLDSDGWPDLYLGTGAPELGAVMPDRSLGNRAGAGFEDVTATLGLGRLRRAAGAAFGDLDHDGDLDLFVQSGGEQPYDAAGRVLYENPGHGHAWVGLLLEGRQANRLAVGARIEVRVRDAGKGRRSVHRLVGTGGSHGGSSLRQTIGLGPARTIESITIRWPGSGVRQLFSRVPPGRYYRAIEGVPELEPLDLPRPRLGASPPAGDGGGADLR